jgi:hypothetical protein
MRRRLAALLAMVVIIVMTVAVPAYADKGGVPADGSCGVGTAAHFVIADEREPGASEVALPESRPQEIGCAPGP